MVLTALADGRIDPRETDVAARLVRETAELQALSDRGQLSKDARELLKRKGLIGAVQELAVAIGDARSRELAVVCCARVLAADGVVAGPELEVMGQLRRSMGYSVEELEHIIASSR